MGARPSRHRALSLSGAGSPFWVQTYAALSNSGAGPCPSRHKALRHEGKHLPLWKKAPTHKRPARRRGARQLAREGACIEGEELHLVMGSGELSGVRWPCWASQSSRKAPRVSMGALKGSGRLDDSAGVYGRTPSWQLYRVRASCGHYRGRPCALKGEALGLGGRAPSPGGRSLALAAGNRTYFLAQVCEGALFKQPAGGKAFERRGPLRTKVKNDFPI
jgi:hypothetical protein